MRIIHLIFTVILFHTQQAWSNNVQVSNVRLTGQNTIDDFTMVEFDISWENSWRYNSGPNNWDAAWIFVKYRVGVSGAWQHAWLNNTGHTACSNAVITNGFLSPELPYSSNTNPSLGVFLYGSTPGTGSFSCQDVQLRWNYASNTVSDDAQVDIKVFAIEMVYIPEGSFYVGSGGQETGAFYSYPNTTSPFYISGEDQIIVGTQPGNLYYSNPTGTSGDQSGPIPAAYPKGFNPFYCLKYEISQQSYVDFLNTLSRQQQINRVQSNISGTSIQNIWVLTNTVLTLERSFIKCHSVIPPQPGPVEFQADHNGNNIGGEDSDGHHVACGYLSSDDVAAYLDWAALRLMTEFEFEKCARGPLLPVPNEYVWGNNVYYPHNGVMYLGTANEVPTDPKANAVSDFNDGPLRTGAFARGNSDRTSSGATYYGCMELGTNLFEKGVTVGTPDGRAYTGKHGDGLLNETGSSNVSMWPNWTGIFFRGGSWLFGEFQAQLSQRSFTVPGSLGRDPTQGGRGVRTVQ